LNTKRRVQGGYFRELKKNATAEAVAFVGGRTGVPEAFSRLQCTCGADF
jgi:hypothetical protein